MVKTAKTQKRLSTYCKHSSSDDCIRHASSLIRIRSCAPESDFDGEVREDFLQPSSIFTVKSNAD